MWREEGIYYPPSSPLVPSTWWEGVTVPSRQINCACACGREKHSFCCLKVATRYEARVKAKNKVGWSGQSPVYHFATRGAGKDCILNLIFGTKPNRKDDLYLVTS
jgi:hypothetical protein